MKTTAILFNILISTVTAGIVVYIINVQLSEPANDIHEHPNINTRIMKVEQDDANQNVQIEQIKQDDIAQNAQIEAIKQDIKNVVKQEVSVVLDAIIEQRLDDLVREHVKKHDGESKKWRECVSDKLSQAQGNPNILTRIPECPFIETK